MEYKQAVDRFYEVYEELKDQMDLTHHTLITEDNAMIEVWRRGALVVRVEDEDTTNIWRRATEYLINLGKLHGCTGATKRKEITYV